MGAAGAVFDDYQDVETPQEYGVHVNEVDYDGCPGPAR
jgi:hypothetical protein